ncbi:MAG: NAD kinase [Microbacterium sp.]|jgi:NAD+ kinase|uniref:NAD kinase n=1 Tax=Microbacterium ginsengisoli TaxID=400772 RepID=A0A3C1K9N8_9MICO|nr:MULTISPECIES: NAD kinase [unclassified Microbacterium]MAL07857.1 NAD kinase [Microbacterium sp.]MBN9199174.1 NAD kinase [Microbacterium ginsengisoli]MCK9913941.1 NAD kinase [Microbacteriaceae bacterium K1510]KQR92245.1 NAD kinase [Microbacterium sp. Leaf351]KQR92756.1 NAD kinase [Microbacterium sp. Leaf347]
MSEERYILVVAHARRAATVDAAERVIRALLDAGASPVLARDDREELGEVLPAAANLPRLGIEVPVDGVEIAVVLGGDGTILRAAELVRGAAVPILGINLGHVGFLAESERDDLDEAVARVISREYRVEERLTVSVRVKNGRGEVVYETWALNEATVEKASRERMLEVVIEIDGRPLSSFGCDGVVVSTPTGSTAYNFSAGGPVIWPSVEALAVVPLSAHALFAKPLVVGPEAAVAVEVLARTDGVGILWADGRRSHELPPGARVVVRRSPEPVRLARLHAPAFTDRLVRKFHLPVDGWRGPDELSTGTHPIIGGARDESDDA